VAKDEKFGFFKMMPDFENLVIFSVKLHSNNINIGLVGFEPTTKPL